MRSYSAEEDSREKKKKVRELEGIVGGTRSKMSSWWTWPAVLGQHLCDLEALLDRWLTGVPMEGGRRHRSSLSPEECGRGNALGTPNAAFWDSVVSILALERPNHCMKKSRLDH